MSPPAPSPSVPARVLVTAGPTHEPIDAVRYIGNRSSGRMGVAIAAAAAARGHPTTLLLGPTALPLPDTTLLVVRRFRTTEDLRAALRVTWPQHDVLFMAAAVADYRPEAAPGGPPHTEKIPRRPGRLTIDLVPTPDLVGTLAQASRPDQTLIGFALEPPRRLLERARQKLETKGLDAIVANPLATMDDDEIAGAVLLASGEMLSPPAAGPIPKADFAAWLVDQIAAVRSSKQKRSRR